MELEHSQSSRPAWTFYTPNSLRFNKDLHLFKRIQLIGDIMSLFAHGASASSNLTYCKLRPISIYPCHSHRFFRSRSQNPPFCHAACGSIRFIRSQLHPQSLPITLHPRCSKNLRNMAVTRPSFQSSPGCISNSSIPFNLPHACTIPGHGGLLVNF